MEYKNLTCRVPISDGLLVKAAGPNPADEPLVEMMLEAMRNTMDERMMAAIQGPLKPKIPSKPLPWYRCPVVAMYGFSRKG